MVKAVLFFMLCTCAIAFGIILFKESTGQEKLKTLAAFGFAAACSLLSLMFITAIVILF